jgi:YesN/AraC family two-component response regulator
MKMPTMNGLEFITHAKKEFPNLAYYILTGYDITDEIADALNNHLIIRCFQKPFNKKEIEDSIKEVIKQL